MTHEEPPGYAILGPLGAGGTAELFLAERRALGGSRRRVALKRVLPAFAHDPTFRELFLHEARVAMQLSHRNVVQVYDCVEWGSSTTLVMEYIDGCDLRTLLTCGGPLPVELAVFVGLEVLRGLDYAHRRLAADGRPLEIVHRDVTPGNILLSREGEVKLADFGLARSTERLVRSAAGVKGTFAFMAPEQADGAAVDARADLFATAAVVHAAITGHSPFSADGPGITLDRVRRAEVEPLGIAPLDEVLGRALRRDPGQRWASAAAMGAALEPLLPRARDHAAELARIIGTLAPPPALRSEPSAASAPARSPAMRPAESEARHASSHHTRVLTPRARPRGGRATPALFAALALAAGLVVFVKAREHRVTRSPVRAEIPPTSPPAPPVAQAPRTEPARSIATPPVARPRPGHLTVNVDPWAYVFIDGRPRGTTPLAIELGAGPHEVRLENPALGASQVHAVRIAAGERRTLIETLTVEP